MYSMAHLRTAELANHHGGLAHNRPANRRPRRVDLPGYDTPQVMYAESSQRVGSSEARDARILAGNWLKNTRRRKLANLATNRRLSDSH